MDSGGVWNGTVEVTGTTGDTFQLTVCNTATGNNNTAFDIAANVTLETGFSYVANTAAGIPGITATQAGTLLTFNIPANTDISTNTCRTISYGLVTSTTAGTHYLNYQVNYSTADAGAAFQETKQQNVLVELGAVTMLKGPANQLKAVGDPVTWTVTVTNTGGGGLFGLSIDESVINPGPALSFTSITQTAPALPAAALAGARLTLPYLAPGQQFKADVAGTVTGCSNINNTAWIDDRSHISSGSVSTQVLLDFKTPLVTFTAPALSLSNLAATPVSILVQNTGHGIANNVVLGTTLHTLDVTVSNVGAGWTYDAVSGSFTKTSGGGDIANLASDTLTFDLNPHGHDLCSPSANGIYFINGNYQDGCGNAYNNPIVYNNYSFNYINPTISLAKSMPGTIVTPATGLNASLTITITRPDMVATDPLVVIDTLPANVSAIALGAPTGGSVVCGGACGAGDTVTWTIPKPGGAATASYNLPYTFAVPNVVCADRQTITNQAAVSAASTMSCNLSASVSASSLLTNTVSTVTHSGYTQDFRIAAGTHETGLPSANLVRDAGEGEFIAIYSTYSFPASFGGTWTGTTYRDDYGGAGSSTMTLVPGSLTVSRDGGAPVAVPPGSITATAGQLLFSAAFLKDPGYFNSDSVAGHSVRFDYRVTASDIILGGNTSISLNHFSNFEVGGGPIDACISGGTTKIIQQAGNALARASEALSLQMPPVVDVCQTFIATATLTASNFAAYGSSLTVLTNGNYNYAVPQTPVYGGLFNAGNIAYAPNAGFAPSFTYTGASLLGSGTVGVQMRRKASAGTINSPLSVTGEYDDWQTDPTAARDFTTGASATPQLTRIGRLSLTLTPQAISITGSQAKWVIYANNNGSGGLYNLVIKDELPAGLMLNVSSTNAQNPNFPVSVTGSTATWSQTAGALPIDIAPGGGIALTVIADVIPGSCSIPANSNRIPAYWGCDGVNHEALTKNDLTLTFPTGSIQSVHDSVNTFTKLCSEDYDTIIVRNTGLTHLYDAKAYEVLEAGNTGISLVLGSVEVSTNSGTTWTALGASGNPTGDGSASNKYTWTQAQVPQLADIAPFGEPGGHSSVRLRFKIAASETANGLIPPVQTSASASRACGDAISDAGTPYSILVKKPSLTVTKTGRNITENASAPYTDTVYGGQGDVIEWRTVAQNNGLYQAERLRFTDMLPNTGAATVSGPGITGSPALTSNFSVRVATLAVAASDTYLVTQTLGAACVAEANTANLSWGCTEKPDGFRSNLDSPLTSTDTAQLVMVPTFDNAGSTVTFNALAGGRAEVVLNFVNSGGTAKDILVISTIAAGFTLDTTYTPTFATDGGLTVMTPDLGVPASPRFAFTGSLRNAKYLQVKYRVIQTGNFDVNTSSFTNPETTAGLSDPALPAGGTVSGEINFASTCNDPAQQTFNGVLDPKTPDVDMTVSPASVIVAAGASQTFNFTLTNNGDAGSTADHIAWSLPTVGTGWTITAVTVQTPGSGGSGGACAGGPTYICSEAQIGTLAAAASAVIRVVATANDNGGNLSLIGEVEGSLYADNAADTGSNYSLDRSAPKVVGVAVSKSLVTTSEAFTSTATLAIGEEATFLLRARWFGGENIGAITLRDTLPAGLSFVSASTTTTSHDLSSPTVSGANPYNFTVNAFSGAGTLEIKLVARAQNIAGNTNGKVLTNNLGLSFASQGVTYASNQDGFGGGYPALHASTATTIARPALSIDKQVMVTTFSVYGQTGSGQGGNTLEYRVVVANTGSAPAFDITVLDVPATGKLILFDGGSDEVDNDGDGTTDGADSATEGFYYAVGGGSVTFNDANTGLPSGSGLGRLDPGNSLTLTYRAQISTGASPNDSLLNGATYFASSLQGASGSQTGTPGVPGAQDGELLLSGTDIAAVSVSTISFLKTLVTTAQGADVSTSVVVGEQLRYEISMVLPAGTLYNFKVYDQIPPGMRLVATPNATLGSAITQAQPAKPALADGPVAVWDFGTVSVSSNSSAAQRTLTVPYVAQVRNYAANQQGLALINRSTYSYTGSLPVNFSTVTVGIVESSSTLTVALSTNTPLDAGAVIIATITVTSVAGRPVMYDSNLLMTLPADLSYVPGSTVKISGPDIPEPVLAGSNVTWGRSQTQDIDISTTSQFRVQLLVGNTAEPGRPLGVTVRHDWTSLNGAPGPDLGAAVAASGAAYGERDGGGTAPNTYFRVASATLTVTNSYSVSKSSSLSTIADGSFRIGDLITYTVTATFQEGTARNVRLRDTLPAGLGFYPLFTPTWTQGSGSPFSYTAQPVAGSTGTLTWDLGTVVNAWDNDPANNTLTLTYKAQVLDAETIGNPLAAPSNPLGISSNTLINSAVLNYVNFGDIANNSNTSGSTVTVKQPLLTLVKALGSGQSSTVAENELVAYRITVTNAGTGNAYNIKVRDTLPIGMRNFTPVTNAVTLNGASVTVTPSYNSGTGLLEWSLADAQLLEGAAGAARTLVIDYQARMDSPIGGGLPFSNSAMVEEYFSKPASDPVDRRKYAATASAATTVNTPAPTDIAKTVSLSSAAIGETIVYTIKAPATPVSVALFNLRVQDTIPAGLTVTGISDNSAAITPGSCGTVSVTDNTLGNSLNLLYNCLPPGAQAVITATAKVSNIPGNQAGTVISNTAAYTWAKTSGGAAQSSISTAGITTTLAEPVLAIDKTYVSITTASATLGLQAGDKVKYRIKVVNASGPNVAPAYNLAIRDLADANLILPAVTNGPDNPGPPVDEGTAGGITSYRWDLAGPLAPGATYQFYVELTLGPGVHPLQTLVNASSVTWTSLPGAVAGERDGSGGVNDYLAADATPVSVITGPVHVEKDLLPPGALTYPVGGLATYRITFSGGEGTANSVHLFDTLPAGLAFSSASVTVVNSLQSNNDPVAVLSGPAAGDTGVLDFNLGNLKSTGANPAVYLDVTARVRDIGGNVNGTTLTNSVSATIVYSTGGVVTIPPALVPPTITVQEPRLVVGLDAPAGAVIDAGSNGMFTLRAQNFGSAEAYQPVFNVVLSTGLRATDPTGLPIAVSISGGRTLALGSGTDYTASYAAGTGVLTITLISSTAYVAAGETLSAAFRASPDNDPVNGVTLLSTGAVTAYFSRDTSGGAAPDTRAYNFTVASSTGGLADGAPLLTGYDHGDDALVAVRAPVLSLIKTAGSSAAVLPAQTTLSWSVAISNAGPVASQAGVFSDDLGAFTPSAQYIKSGTLSAVSVSSAPAGFADVSAPAGGTGGKGLVSITGLVIPAASTVTVSFNVLLSSSIPDSTKIYNQASLSAAGFTGAFLSDSYRVADDSGTESGNNASDPNDDDPTSVTIVSAPGLSFEKTAADDDGGTLVAGDTVTYTLTLHNHGTERALSAVLTDAIPPNTAYVPSSTLLNGVLVPDAGGLSPLAAGLAVNTPGESSGVLAVYTGTEEAVVAFKVRVSTEVAQGTKISNQGFVRASGEGTSKPLSKLSDDPATAPAPDPTDLVVSGAAFLLSEKTVSPAGFTVAGATLTYTITVRNIGDEAAAMVVVRDTQPVNAAYIPGTLQFDQDGSGPAAGMALTDAADADAGDYNTTHPGELYLAVGTVPARGQASVSFQAVVALSVTTGSVVANQAAISALGLPDTRSDGDGDHGNGDQPVYTVVGGGLAVLRQSKQVLDVNGGSLMPGDTVEYLITTYNIGDATATAVTVLDSVPPAGTAYVPGSTIRDNTVLADAAGVSPLTAGVALGDIYPGLSNTLRFRVAVATNAAAGAIIDNQASFSANAGALTGLSDSNLDDGVESGNSPGDPNDDDPTRVQVGGAPGSAALSGLVWLDINHDRSPTAGEVFQAGWTVEVLQGGLVVASQLTGADGSYRIANLTPGGGYQLRFRHPVSGVVYGRAVSAKPGAVTTDGTIRNLTLAAGENLLNQNLPLDPNGLLYDAVTRQPIAGVPVYLDGPPGFVAAAHLLPGQYGQVTAPDGFYRFDLNFAGGAPFGVYTLRFATPPNYITNLPGTPSAILPPLASSPLCAGDNCLDVPLAPAPYLVQAQVTAPAGAQPTDHYLRFQFDNLLDAAVVNNHIPLDPILEDAIFVAKTAMKAEVSRGELVLYTITAHNTLSATLTSIKLHDLLPPGFKYRAGSATMNGAAAEPAVNGRHLDWTGLTFAPAETKTFKLLLIVGAGVSEGNYVNQAWTINTLVDARVSNIGAATVRVVPDPLFDCTDVLGKVFYDEDTDGYQDQGERGVANAKVVTARGWTFSTDAYGRFHVACADIPAEDRGSNFIMKLDEQSLPTGYRMTTENPRVIRLTRGKAANIEFGVALYQVVRLDISSAAFAVKHPCVPATVELKPVWDVVTYTPPIPVLRFENAKFEVTPEHVALIRSVVEKVRSMPDIKNIKVRVIGHTDSSPITGKLAKTIADNWVLSRSRAERVGALLLEKLPDIIKKDMVRPEGRADTEPLVPNDTPEGKALNRRVLVEITYEKSVERFVQVPVSGDCGACVPAHTRLETDWAVVEAAENIPVLRFANADSSVTLAQVADIHVEWDRISNLPGIRNVGLKIVGHTDSSPITGALANTIPDNLVLSRYRAENVRSQLMKLFPDHEKIRQDSVTVEGKGETQPLASNNTPAGKALNRRVEVRVTYEQPELRVVDVPASSECAKISSATAVVAVSSRLPWQQAVDRAMKALERRPSVLRLGYCQLPGELIEESRFRVWQVGEEIRRRWLEKPDRYALVIENEFSGAYCAGGGK